MTATKKPAEAIKPEPTAGFLRKLEKLAIDKVADMLEMPTKPKGAQVAVLSAEQEAELRSIEAEAIIGFNGDFTQLEAALGMLRIGHHVGWKVLYLIHSKQTIRLYEDILNIRIREVFEETGPSSYRSVGLNLAERFSNFWKVAGGDIKIPRRRDVVS